MSRKTVREIPPELVIEILARLPVKPLLRWKCACKSWLSLISNDVEFAKKHLHFAKNDTIVNRYRLLISSFPFRSVDHDAFCYSNNLVKRELSFPILGVHPTEFAYIGSCNGIIAANWRCKRLDIHFIVWNPTTGDFRELQASDSTVDGEIFWGFGYDSNLDDYKIVMVEEVFPFTGRIKLEVFSLKANEWKWSQDVHSDFLLPSRYSSSNGLMHWLVDLAKDPGEKLGIVSFDLGETKFLEMVPVPHHITKKLFASRCLRIVSFDLGDNLWVWTNYGRKAKWYEGWMIKRDGTCTELYSFSRDTLPRCESFIEVMWVAKNGNVVLDVDGCKLFLYNPEEQSSLEYGVSSRGKDAPITYIETLVSPKCIQKPNQHISSSSAMIEPQKPSLDKQSQA